MFAEIVGGILSGSLALVADAGHMATNAAAIALALLVTWLADKGPTAERTFGFYRTEILAALFNAVSLWVAAGYILIEAYNRFVDVPHIEGVEGVTIVHDLHVWTISSGYDALSAHVLVDRNYHGGFDALLNRLREVVKGRYGITHVTLQMEYSTTECDEAHPPWSLLTEKRLARAEGLLEPDAAG